ncbi:unnamed protein product [Owenia fusiformis]|uniref:Uncharacterized protein n=1 Tax=Owenia fusiformis TaxID=6347 RepID=A0A8J1XPJ2_OWEFU|nr:unnamed protein product [Owenia fusiformis]
MATVMHGRRKGTKKAQPKPGPYETLPTEIPLGMQLKNGTDLREVTVLTGKDWQRIQNSLNRNVIEEQRIAKLREEREALRQRSKDTVKNWGNTIAGQRQRKLEARKIREEKEEEERKQIDLEEATFQSQKRKEAIEKAKTQQYYQTDRVKGFHGALMLTEVLKEREAQLELKALKEKANEGKDKAWLEKAQKDYEEGVLEDQRKAQIRIDATRKNAMFQKAQVKEHLKEGWRDKDLDRAEGEELKALAAQYALEKQRLEQIRFDERKGMMQDNVKRIGDVRKMKEIHRLQEEEEDEECRIFAAAKRKMMKLRTQKEKMLHNEKQERLERIREKLFAQQQQKKDDEDERIRNALEEKEKARMEEEERKNAKLMKAMKEMGDHRYQQMKEIEDMKAEERVKEMEMLKIKKEADNVFRQNEEEKRRRKLEEAKGLAKFHFQQNDERLVKDDKARQEQLARDKRNMELLAVEEQQFQEYAKRVIDHCEKGGRNTIPLRKAAKAGAGGGAGPVFEGKGGVRPSYMASDQSGVQMPNYQRDTTEETKSNIYGEASQKRLGFVW